MNWMYCSIRKGFILNLWSLVSFRKKWPNLLAFHVALVGIYVELQGSTDVCRMIVEILFPPISIFVSSWIGFIKGYITKGE